MIRPTTTAAAADMHARGHCLFAGGTGVAFADAVGRNDEKSLVDLAGLADLTVREVADGVIRIGALTTLSCIEHFTEPELQALAAAARQVAGPGVRRLATIGGNLGWLDGPADLQAPLLVTDAAALVWSDGARQTVPVAEVRTMIRSASLLIEAIEVPIVHGRRTGFARFAARAASAASIATAAVSANVTDRGLESPRLALGGPWGDARLVPKAARAIEEGGPTEAVERAAEAVRVAVAEALALPPTDYRVAVCGSVAQAATRALLTTP